jgi:hypothetical protein
MSPMYLLTFQTLSTTQFIICIPAHHQPIRTGPTHQTALGPCSGDINRLMIMMIPAHARISNSTYEPRVFELLFYRNTLTYNTYGYFCITCPKNDEKAMH